LIQNFLYEILERDFIAVICGRYEGVDERFIEEKVDMEVSIGDFIVSGGELPSLILIESLLRFLPGIIGNEMSLDNDSFGINFQNLLKGPVYTRPKIINGREVPEILLSGDPKKISKWRENISKKRTQERRKDL
jgi:tRNA-(guanine-N1)-methyltransferase